MSSEIGEIGKKNPLMVLKLVSTGLDLRGDARTSQMIDEAIEVLRDWNPTPDPAHQSLVDALEPFANFYEKAECFVADTAANGGKPIMPTKDFRLADFKRAYDVLAALNLQGGNDD